MAIPFESGPSDGPLINDSDLVRTYNIVRRDGRHFRFTDHDREIEVFGNLFSPSVAGALSAVRKESGMKGVNHDYSGIIDDDLITHDDLLAGRFNGATVLESIVSWRYPQNGAMQHTHGVMKRAIFDSNQWSIEVEDVQVLLREPRGRSYGSKCDFDLGDSNCNKDISADIIYDATIATRITRTDGTINRTIFTADPTGTGGKSLSNEDGFYTFGKIIWATGANQGVVSEVKTYTQLTKTIELQDPVPVDPEVGDEFILHPGCDHRHTTCRDKFDNLIRFGGFPYIPGVNYLMQQPLKQ